MTSSTNAWITALAPVCICAWLAVDILSRGAGDAPLVAYLELGNLGVGLLIGLSTRFRNTGMTWALSGMAAGQLGIAVAALLLGMGSPGIVIVVNGIIAGFFGLAAWQFWQLGSGAHPGVEETGSDSYNGN